MAFFRKSLNTLVETQSQHHKYNLDNTIDNDKFEINFFTYKSESFLRSDQGRLSK